MAPTSFNFDSFDPVLAGEPSVVEVIGRTHSRLLEWAGPTAALLGPDLATAWEQPSPDRLILHLDPRARWHPPADRPLAADDVAAHFSRLLAAARGGRLPLGQRPTDLAVIERVTASPGALVFEASAPAPLLPALLASRFALIALGQPAGDEVGPGTGPFALTGRADGGLQFAAFRAGHRQPSLDRLAVVPPSRDLDAFRSGTVQEFIARDRRDAPALRGTGAVELARFEDSSLVSTMFVGAAPWNRLELRKALSAALNRGRLSRELFASRAAAAAPIPPVHAAALAETRLSSYPGYRQDEAVDAREARQLWEAAGGPALGAVTVDIPAVLDPLYAVGATVTRILNETLNPGQFRYAIEGYPAISAKAADRRYGNGVASLWFGWGPPFPDPDPAVGVLQTYRDSQDELGWRDSGVSASLARLAVAMDARERDAILRDLQVAILEAGGLGVFDWLVQRNEVFRSPRLHRAFPSPFWTQSLDASAWIEA